MYVGSGTCLNVSLLGVQSMHYDMIEIQHSRAIQIRCNGGCMERCGVGSGRAACTLVLVHA